MNSTLHKIMQENPNAYKIQGISNISMTAQNIKLNPSFSIQSVLTLPSNTMSLTSEGFFLVSYSMKTTAAVKLRPSWFLNCISSFNFTQSGFENINISSNNQNRSINLFSNLNKLLTYDLNKMVQLSQIEDMPFISNYSQYTTGVTTNLNALMLNPGLMIPANKITYLQYKIPLASLSSLSNILEAQYGLCQFNFTMNCYPTNLYKNIADEANVTEFTIQRIDYFYTGVRFPVEIARTLEYTQGQNVILNVLPAFWTMNLLANQINIVNLSCPNIQLSPNEISKICFCPYIYSKTGSPGCNIYPPYSSDGVAVAYLFKDYLDKDSELGTIQCLSPGLSIQNAKISFGGIENFPTNNILNFQGVPFSTFVNYNYSVIQSINYSSYANNLTALPFDLYRDYFQILCVNLEEISKNNFHNQVNVSFDIVSTPEITAAGSLTIMVDYFIFYKKNFVNKQ